MPCYHSCQVCKGLGVAGACEFGLPLISGRDISSQEDLIKKELDGLVSFQREWGPALGNKKAHTWALLQWLRHAVSLHRLQQSCSSGTLCVYSSSSPNNLLPFHQKLSFWFHRDGHDGVLTPSSSSLLYTCHPQLYPHTVLVQLSLPH